MIFKLIYKPMKKQFAVLLSLVIFAFPLAGQTRFDVSFSVDWTKTESYALVSYDLAQAGVRLPAGRLMGEEILKEAYPRLLRPHLLSIRADSGSTLGDLVERGDLLIGELDAISREAGVKPPNLSTDLSRMIGRYTLVIEKISSLLTRHRRAIEPDKPLIPVQTADYTGIIIIVDGEQPIWGRKSRSFAEPCIFPKIWDTNMNLVYERNMLEPGIGRPMVRYTSVESVIRPTPSGLEGELAELLGRNPLRILARGIFGINPTDPVIDRDDALKILSSENNRRLLREGRVALVLSAKMLRF
jgi:hypothetical protein